MSTSLLETGHSISGTPALPAMMQPTATGFNKKEQSEIADPHQDLVCVANKWKTVLKERSVVFSCRCQRSDVIYTHSRSVLTDSSAVPSHLVEVMNMNFLHEVLHEEYVRELAPAPP